jgi:hypothetical protein
MVESALGGRTTDPEAKLRIDKRRDRARPADAVARASVFAGEEPEPASSQYTCGTYPTMDCGVAPRRLS